MADFEISGIDNIKNKLQSLLDAKEQALNMAGASLLADVQQSFVQSGFGEWAERKPQMRRGVRIDTWKLLWKTGTLFRSMTMNADVDNSSIEIGTSVAYAQWLNNGTRKMVARPFLFVDDNRIEHATNAFYAVLQNVVNS